MNFGASSLPLFLFHSRPADLESSWLTEMPFSVQGRRRKPHISDGPTSLFPRKSKQHNDTGVTVLQCRTRLYEQLSTVIRVPQTAVKGIEGKCAAAWHILLQRKKKRWRTNLRNQCERLSALKFLLLLPVILSLGGQTHAAGLVYV